MPRTESLISALPVIRGVRREERTNERTNAESRVNRRCNFQDERWRGGFRLSRQRLRNRFDYFINRNNKNGKKRGLIPIVLFFSTGKEGGGREGGRKKKKKKSTHHYRLLFVQNTTPTERINVVSEIVPLCKHISIRYRPAYLIALHFFPRPLLNLSLLSLLLLRDREIRMNPRSEMLLLFHEKKETPTWRILNTCTTPFFKRKQRGRGKKREKRYISFRDKAEFICSEWITLTDVLAIHHPNAKWPRRRRRVIRFASAHIPRSITAVVEKHAHAKDNYALIALNLWNNLLYNAGRGREKRGGERGGGRAYSDRTKGDGARRGETRSVGRGGFAPPKEEVAGTGSRPIFRISRFSTPSARLTLAYRFKDNLLCRVSSFQSRETRIINVFIYRWNASVCNFLARSFEGEE